jgi:uncharacterized membrane protein YbhN (UPF0104 family)
MDEPQDLPQRPAQLEASEGATSGTGRQASEAAPTLGALHHPAVRVVLLIGLGVAAFFVVIAVLRVDVASVVASVRRIRVGHFALVCLFAYGVVAGNAARWRTLAGGQVPISYAQTFAAFALGFFVNLLLPLRGGDLGRVVLVGRISGRSVPRLLALELLDRTVDFASMAALAAALFAFSPLPGTLKTGIVSILVASLVAVALLLWAGRFRLQPGQSRWRRWLGQFAEGARAIRGVSPLVAAFLIGLLPWIWETGMLLLMGRACGSPLSPAAALAVLLAINLSFVVPVPGQVGAYEGLGVATLIFFGVDHATAVAFMFLFHLAHIVPNSLLGLGLMLGGFGRRPAAVTEGASPSESDG